MAEPISVAIPTPKVDLTVIQVTRPEPTDTDPKTAEIAQWTERDQIGRGAILSALSNTLFDVYCSDSYTAKSLWDELDRKYNTEEQGLEKYSVSKFMRYQMVEDRSVAEQTHEIINLEHALADAEMKLPEKFLVMSIVDKFPKSWENFGMTLKHQKGRLSLDDLMIAISIEEEHRNQTHKMPVEHQPRANLIVGKQRVNKINSNSKAINKGKTTKNKKPKANKPCWNCGQVGHWAKLCPNKKAKTGQAVVNMVVGGSSGASTSGATEGYVSVQPELLTIYEPCDWLIDTGANVHVCADKSLFVLSGHHWKDKTPPYSPSSNGVAERKNRTFKDMINSLLLTSGLPKYLWGEALNTACHILNRVPLKHNTSTPFELWKGRKPSLKYFRVWGCLAKVLVLEHKRKKLGPKTVDAVFLGYVETSYALRFLVIKSEIPGIEVNTIVEFHDGVFLEDVFPIKIGIPSSVSLDDSLASTSLPEHVEKMTNVGVNPNSASLTHEESDIPRRSKRARVVKDFGSDFVTYNIEDDPVTFKDAMASLEAKQWKKAVKSEMDSIVSNGTWVLVDLPLECTTIGCKWIFKKKLKPDGSIDKFKARLVAKGFKQKEGIDYFDTYSPVARLTTIRVLIALASVYNLSIHQMDVKSLLNKFEMKDMGEADVILGIKLIRSTDGIAISQSHYVEKILEKFGYQNNRIAKTPYDSSVALFKNKSGVSVAQLRYTSCPDKTHWGALDRVLRWGRSLLEVCKTDFDTRSTFEAELCALDTTGTEAEWLFGLLSQLPIVSQPLPPIAVHCDSQTTIAKVRSRKYNQKTKRHIQVRLKSIRALVSDRVIGIDFVGTKNNVADPLTKGLDLSQGGYEQMNWDQRMVYDTVGPQFFSTHQEPNAEGASSSFPAGTSSYDYDVSGLSERFFSVVQEADQPLYDQSQLVVVARLVNIKA
ncbi:UNVERIFIED_CONTAM: Retrovirus-related Pol polyprotein from transposon TNT 1-94 [Sesamum radiatum]|uniref:Retrovirus-related Pol polyprotein from transposon TNT 1-94 n=1 Tax=Sesamum radiatum TaxID=300843 RepID=A0AAW2KLC0_SESRA